VWWFELVCSGFVASYLYYVPLVGTMEINEAVEYVQSKPNSLIANEPKIMEGIVARSTPLLLFRDGNPLMWKLKVRDYKDA